MAKVEFTFRGIITTILCSEKDKMEDICQRFATKTSSNINDLCFLYSGTKMNLQNTFEQIANSIDKERKTMSILVNEIISESLINNPSIIKSNFPICPKCKESVYITIDNYKIISSCKYLHSIKMLLNEFEDNQKIDISKIMCKECKKDKSKTFNNEMYICNKCNIQLCPLCKNIHNKTHNIINYDSKDYICRIHNEIFISFCNKCKVNMCLQCQREHKTHNIILYSDIMPYKNELLKKLSEFRSTINLFNKNIDEIINKFKNVKENTEILYNIYNDMINKYEDKYRNYEILLSLNSINNIDILNDLNYINQIDNINQQVERILNIYDKMNFDNEITMIYNSKKEKKIKILNRKFVNNNKNICKIIYKNKEYELIEEIDIKNIQIDKLEIKLKGINNVTNMESIFNKCKLLEELPDISRWNTNKVVNMSYLFYECEQLKSLPDISKWNTSKVTSMRGMFLGCKLIKSLPDLSKWNTNKVTDISFLFYGCSSLKSLFGISKWNTSNITSIQSIFYECKALGSLPDISNWNTNKINDMSFLFYLCSSLISLPDISKWDI